jgi:hypothetical protein
MAPRAVVMKWPNGETTRGRLAGSEETGLRFLAGEIEGPLKTRCMRADRFARAGLRPGPIEVAMAPEAKEENVVRVAPRLLKAVHGIDPKSLRELAQTAGGKSDGLCTDDQVTLSKVIEGVLRWVEADAVNPKAVRHAIEALKRPFIELKLTPDAGAPGDYQCTVSNAKGDHGSQVGDLGTALEGLREGEHLYVRAAQEDEENEHALALCATRLSRHKVQLNAFNSNGWAVASGNPYLTRFPVVTKTVSLDEALAALRALPTRVVKRPPALQKSAIPAWNSAEFGMPLFAWLGSVSPYKQLSPTWQHMPPQKGDDCAIEVEFAWLASVLPEADYKLAKAHTLNVLTQAALANNLEEDVVRRLHERVTTSLSAHVMAAAAEPRWPVTR